MPDIIYGANSLKRARTYYRPRMSMKQWAREVASGTIADPDQAKYAGGARRWLDRKRKVG